MKNVVLFGYGKMGSAIAKGWKLKNLNFNFFVVEKEISLRKIASNDGIKTYENFEQLLKFVDLKTLSIIFLAVKPQQMNETVKVFSTIDFSNTLFISIAAGLSFDWFQSNLKKTLHTYTIILKTIVTQKITSKKNTIIAFSMNISCTTKPFRSQMKEN